MEGAAPAPRDEAATAARTTGYEPSPLSVQVRGMRTSGDAQARIQDNMMLAFKTLMPRLDAVYASRSAAAPDGFEARHQRLEGEHHVVLDARLQDADAAPR